jgi:trehalose-6-phosphate synthase
MGEASVEINDPKDVEETAKALETALDMSKDERKRRAEDLRRRAQAHKPEDWIESQLDDLEAIQDGKPPISPAC